MNEDELASSMVLTEWQLAAFLTGNENAKYELH